MLVEDSGDKIGFNEAEALKPRIAGVSGLHAAYRGRASMRPRR